LSWKQLLGIKRKRTEIKKEENRRERKYFFLHVSHNLRALTLQLSSSTSFPFELYRRNINVFSRGKVKGDEVGTCAVPQKNADAGI